MRQKKRHRVRDEGRPGRKRALILGLLLLLSGSILALGPLSGYRRGRELYGSIAGQVIDPLGNASGEGGETGPGGPDGGDRRGGEDDFGRGEKDEVEEGIRTSMEKEKAPVKEPPPDAPERLAVDFKTLRESMPDAVAWLYLPAVSISYPVMQGEDNSFYLTHAGNGEELFAGSVFLDAKNDPDLSDDNSILYAHNMRDGSMFGRLSDLAKVIGMDYDGAFFWIFTPEKDHLYRIFASRTAEAGDPAYTLSVPEKERGDFVRGLLEQAGVSPEKIPDSLKHVMTLSTCTGDSEIRQIVQGLEILCIESGVYREQAGEGEG